jgi:hypothetical protein
MSQTLDLPVSKFFHRVLAPLYPKDLRDRPASNRVMPVHSELSQIHSQVDSIAETFKRLAPSLLELPAESLDDSDASIHRIGLALTRERRDALIATAADGGEQPSLLAMLIVHGSVYTCRCIVRNYGGLWLFRQPLWESAVSLRSVLGQGELNPFSWWVKSLSDEEVDRLAFADRYRSYVEVPCFNVDAVPVLLQSERAVPKIMAPGYEQLFHHLKAYVPEIRQPGPDFPSAERFADMDFAWLDFLWVGVGRQLLIWGPAKRKGTHLFWMDKNGFVKSAFYQSDDFPETVVRLKDDWIQIIVSMQTELKVHEMPWWGL